MFVIPKKKLAKILNDLQDNKYDCNIVISGNTGCQPKGSKVLMADGSWKNIEEIRKGDKVISPTEEGKTKYAKVISTCKWFSYENYKVFHNSKFYSCSYNHLIPVYFDNKLVNCEAYHIFDIQKIFRDKTYSLSNKAKLKKVTIKLKKSKPEMVYGFELDSDSKLYVTDNWMVTHNSGKSTLAIWVAKLANRHHKFSLRKDLIYARDELIKFYTQRELSTSIVDEAVNTAHNRSFFDEEQKLLVKLLNMNRDKRNIVFWIIPSFATLDTQMRQLMRMRIDVIRRGYAIVHLPKKNIYGKDKWETDLNAKIEREMAEKGKEMDYSRLTTCVGMMRFPALPEKIELQYQKVKDDKRALIGIREGFEEKLEGTALLHDKLTKGEIKTLKEFNLACDVIGIKSTIAMKTINRIFKDEGKNIKVKNILSANPMKNFEADYL